jgi:hypothetical protein
VQESTSVRYSPNVKHVQQVYQRLTSQRGAMSVEHCLFVEGNGLSQIVQDLFENYLAYIHEYVGDNDSSTKKVLRHLWQDEVDRGIRTEVLRYENIQKKPDNGCLPIDHLFIVWLAHKRHRVRLFVNKLFILCRKKRRTMRAPR